MIRRGAPLSATAEARTLTSPATLRRRAAITNEPFRVEAIDPRDLTHWPSLASQSWADLPTHRP
jgi:hypothetical protein